MPLNNDPGSNYQLLEKIRLGDRVFVRQLYERYRSEFRLWLSKNYHCDEDLIADIYQQAFTAFYYNIKESRITELRSSVKTYLFAIGKNLIRDHFKISSRRKEIMEVAIETTNIDHGIVKRYEESHLKETVRVLLSKIGEPCKTVLELFYLRGFALDAIAAEMNYKTEQVAAKRKFICLKQMRALLIETGNQDQF